MSELERTGWENDQDVLYYEKLAMAQRFLSVPPDYQRMVDEVDFLIETAAACDETVLLLGESGCGKSFYAKKIHEMSARKKMPLQKISAAALSPSIIESQLFGTEVGAFTGAVKSKGIFEQADKSTLFIDEIAELPLDLQAKLLCALEDREVKHLGSSQAIPFDARFIFATNKNLRELSQKGLFREDLYYRISVLEIQIPPLIFRKDELQELAKTFAREKGKTLSEVALDKLLFYRWPGNIRELKNVISKSAIFCQKAELDADDIRIDESLMLKMW